MFPDTFVAGAANTLKKRMLVFHYKHTRKQWAAKVLAFMLVLQLDLVLLKYLTEDRAGAEQFIEVATYAILVVEIVMAGLIVWLLKNPANFEIRVTESEFSVSHPSSTSWSFNLKPANIKSFKNEFAIHSGYDEVVITTVSGERYLLCRNYWYSLKKLYAALAKVNPNITFPKNPYIFTTRSDKKIRQTRKARD